MYIRKTKTKTLKQGEAYFTYRIVESVRDGKQVKQRTLFYLGGDFALEPEYWPFLTARIEQLMQGIEPQQLELFDLKEDINQFLEDQAPRYSALIINKMSQPVNPSEQDYHRVDIISGKNSQQHLGFSQMLAQRIHPIQAHINSLIDKYIGFDSQFGL